MFHVTRELSLICAEGSRTLGFKTSNTPSTLPHPENYRWGHFQSTNINRNHSQGDRPILVLAKMLTHSNSMRSHCCIVNIVRMAPLKMVDYLQNISYIKYIVGKLILGVAFTCTHEKPWCTCFSTIMRFHWKWMFRGNLPVPCWSCLIHHGDAYSISCPNVGAETHKNRLHCCCPPWKCSLCSRLVFWLCDLWFLYGLLNTCTED